MTTTTAVPAARQRPARTFPVYVPVIAIWPIDADFRARHHLPAAASLAVVELYEGTTHVCCTDLDAVNGIDAAAAAWAEGTGAVWARRGAA